MLFMKKHLNLLIALVTYDFSVSIALCAAFWAVCTVLAMVSTNIEAKYILNFKSLMLIIAIELTITETSA